MSLKLNITHSMVVGNWVLAREFTDRGLVVASLDARVQDRRCVMLRRPYSQHQRTVAGLEMGIGLGGQIIGPGGQLKSPQTLVQGFLCLSLLLIETSSMAQAPHL